MKAKDSLWVPLIVIISIVIPIAVAGLFLLPEDWKLQIGSANVRSLPFFHAVLNGSTAVLLVIGLFFIKNKNVQWHRYVMLGAFALSAVFLISYVVSHISNPDAKFGGEGWVRPLYFFILISHIVLSIPVLPLAMFAIYRGLTGEIQKHKAVVKYTYPIWLYVAITGVLVYLFMAPYYH